jgi:predicted N-formylglutamate amidohydrolase
MRDGDIVSGQPAPRLLARDEGLPFEILNPGGRARLLITCDHASNRVPRALDGLGLNRAELSRHIAWDIGAASVTRRLSALLDAPAVLSHFSRLVIDPNRRVEVPSSIPTISDGTVVPGNRNLTDDGIRARRAQLFWPYHGACERMIEAKVAAGQPPALIFLHSFTPVFGGDERWMQAAVLWDRDPRLARPLLEGLRGAGIPTGDNEPYSGRSTEDYSLHVHGDGRGLPHVLIELRQDLVDTAKGAEAWAERLAGLLRAILDDPATFRPRPGAQADAETR